jgi:hypothetical protein
LLGDDVNDGSDDDDNDDNDSNDRDYIQLSLLSPPLSLEDISAYRSLIAR